jgi:preprotein translocase subunit SecY
LVGLTRVCGDSVHVDSPTIDQTGANFGFGGTSILIVIGVALDTIKQLEAQLMMRNYVGFLR